MTLAAVWKQDWKQEPRLMAIADTRISRTVGNVLTEHGPKILPLTIICKQPGPRGFSTEAYRFTAGFAYSGSTLSALSAHALGNVLFANLIGNLGAPPPSLFEIAHAMGGVAAEYMRDVCQLAGPDGAFKGIIFGFCPRLSRLIAYQLEPQVENSRFLVRISPVELDAAGSIAVIGTRPQLLRDRIRADLVDAEQRGDTNPIIAMDAPKRALQSLIDEGVEISIGGSVQQAWVTRFGFETVATMVPIKPRPPAPRNVGLLALGFDIFDIQTIGEYMVAMTGR